MSIWPTIRGFKILNIFRRLKHRHIWLGSIDQWNCKFMLAVKTCLMLWKILFRSILIIYAPTITSTSIINFGRKKEILLKSWDTKLIENPQRSHQSCQDTSQRSCSFHQNIHAGIVHVLSNGLRCCLESLKIDFRHVLNLDD